MTGDQEVLALPQSSTTLPILAVLARLAPTVFIHGLRREDVTTGTLGVQLRTGVTSWAPSVPVVTSSRRRPWMNTVGASRARTARIGSVVLDWGSARTS